MNIKAIETSYSGYRFRSRLEARYAVFFDALKEPWEYEKEGFVLPSGCYLPDFWLPRMGYWLEVKGQEPTDLEIQLVRELAESTLSNCFIAYGIPGENPVLKFNFEMSFDEEKQGLQLLFEGIEDAKFLTSDELKELFIVSNSDIANYFRHSFLYEPDFAYTKAKSARFEFAR